MKKIIPIMLLFCSTSFAQEYVLEKMVAPKGYILSVDLFEKECKNIWSKQIGIFKNNNKQIKNPNLIRIGQEIEVCFII